MPWVRLHAVKDYLDMLMVLEKFPKLKLNFNLVPLLVDSIQEYAHDEVHDLHSKLTVTPWEKFSDSDKEFILNNFFDANYIHMILPCKRYRELHKKRYNTKNISIDTFSPEDYTDLTVCFNLCWIDPTWREKYDEVKYLLEKERNYSYEDRLLVIDIHRKIMKEIIPAYKKMQEDGRIEISTSPYYHPIMPLLIDINSTKATYQSGSLPDCIASMKDDAAAQTILALDKFENIFGRRPQGIWPPEHSVSQETLNMLVDLGVKWSISDEGLLSGTLKKEFIRDFRGYLEDPYDLCQTYSYKHSDKKINLLFRDSVLPSLLSFEYQNYNPIIAANDFYERIKAVQDKVVASPSPNNLITIAMDGENCWENYTNDGSTFLDAVYKLIEDDESLETVLVSEYIDNLTKQIELKEIASGSWINRNFQLWIGEPTKNLAWEHLNRTRQDLLVWQDEFQDNPELLTSSVEAANLVPHEDLPLLTSDNATAAQVRKNKFSKLVQRSLAKAWREIHIAQGSDWYWWYGEPNDSGRDHIFDHLFRSHLKNVYLFLGKEPPECLDVPLI